MDAYLWWTLLAFVICFALGLHFGKQNEAARWRANASMIFRIESAGRLFKVTEVKPEEPQEGEAEA